jgi:hypothetical protein
MYLNKRDPGRQKSITKSNAGMRIGPGIDEDEIDCFPVGCVNALYEFVLGIALEACEHMFSGLGLQTLLNIPEGLGTVKARLTHAQHIQVGTIQYEDVGHSGLSLL